MIAPKPAQAQGQPINGMVKTSSGTAVPSVAVVLSDNRSVVVAFANTNKDGRYTLLLPDTTKTGALWIEVNALGYRPIKQVLEDGKNVYNLVLENAAIALKEVKIRSRPNIKVSKDTLSYDVSSFSRVEDRSIGDVIRHMPGLEVADDGRISFNGKTISNLYIHGDDLMDGRYGLATKAITKEMIKSVDVLQNFEPIKILKDKRQTDNVAINLVLKNENSLKPTGQSILGAGLPAQFDASTNVMIFNKKFKMLNSLQGNNSGVDYRDDFKQYGASDFLNDAGNNRPKPLLSIGTASNPDLPRKNYYLNRSVVLNINNLYNLPAGIQLRSNIQMFADRSTMDYNSRTETYLDQNDTLRYHELQNSRNSAYLFNTSLSATVNKPTHYINNVFRINMSKTDYLGTLNFNGKSFNQQLPDHLYDLSNELNWIPALRSRSIININWYVNYYNSSQNLNIDSGIHSEILNRNLIYNSLDQRATLPSYFSNASISYQPSAGLIKQTYQLGIINEIQQLNTSINLKQSDGSINTYSGDAGNALKWQRSRIYLNTTYFLKKDLWEAHISLPIFWQDIHYQQEQYRLNSIKPQLSFSPVIRLKLYTGSEDFIEARYAYNNNAGNIASVFRGLVLTNYRSLRANTSDVQQQFTSVASTTYNFQRSIIMLFINGGLSYGQTNTDVILSNVYTDGIQRSILLPYKNNQSTLSANGGISKYIFALGTTLSIKTSWNHSLYNQFINGEILAFINRNWQGNLAVDSKIFRAVTFRYNNNTIWSNSTLNNNLNAASDNDNRVFRLDQNITLGYAPTNTLLMNISGRSIYNKQSVTSKNQAFFMDVSIKHKMAKWRADLQLDLTNLFGVRSYQTIYLYANQLTVNNYEIRGRMAILRATFNL